MNLGPFQEVLDWSEVWAPMLPLILLTFSGKPHRYLVPVVVYLWFALVLDAIIDVGWKFHAPDVKVAVIQNGSTVMKDCNKVPHWMHPNNYLYNIHSIGRFLCFAAFFYLLGPAFRTRLDKLLFIGALVFFIVNFGWLQPFYNEKAFNSRLFSVESGLLLLYCLRYYLLRAQDKEEPEKVIPSYTIVTGLSVYVVFNFFYFLFYETLVYDDRYTRFATDMWNVHNVTYVILCIFIARAFYAGKRN